MYSKTKSEKLIPVQREKIKNDPFHSTSIAKLKISPIFVIVIWITVMKITIIYEVL
jgi:hypothetical protein